MEKSTRARRRKPDTAKTDLEPPHRGVQLGCTRDEGRPLGLGLQDRGPNHRKLLRHNGRGGERSRKRRGLTASGEHWGVERK